MNEAWATYGRLYGKAQKYRNKRTTVDDIAFDSKKEANRWAQLQLLQKVQEIVGLERQPRYPIEVNGKRICFVVPDFRYFTPTGLLVIEDVKSPATRKNSTYRLKKKLFEALYGLTITEV